MHRDASEPRYGWVVVAAGAFITCVALGAVFTLPVLLQLAMALGPLAGGWAFDASGGYRWLYLGSFAIGLCAVLIALCFPPLPRISSQLKHA